MATIRYYSGAGRVLNKSIVENPLVGLALKTVVQTLLRHAGRIAGVQYQVNSKNRRSLNDYESTTQKSHDSHVIVIEDHRPEATLIHLNQPDLGGGG